MRTPRKCWAPNRTTSTTTAPHSTGLFCSSTDVQCLLLDHWWSHGCLWPSYQKARILNFLHHLRFTSLSLPAIPMNRLGIFSAKHSFYPLLCILGKLNGYSTSSFVCNTYFFSRSRHSTRFSNPTIVLAMAFITPSFYTTFIQSFFNFSFAAFMFDVSQIFSASPSELLFRKDRRECSFSSSTKTCNRCTSSNSSSSSETTSRFSPIFSSTVSLRTVFLCDVVFTVVTSPRPLRLLPRWLLQTMFCRASSYPADASL